LDKHLAILGEGGGRLGFIAVLHGLAHQRRMLGIMCLGLDLAFFNYGVLMYNSYIKSRKMQGE